MGKSLFGEILHGLGEITDAIGSDLNDGKKTETVIGSLFHGLGNATDEFVDDFKKAYNETNNDSVNEDDENIENNENNENNEEFQENLESNEDSNTVSLPVNVEKDNDGNICSAITEFDDGSTYKFSEEEFANIWYSEEEGKYFSCFTINNNNESEEDEATCLEKYWHVIKIKDGFYSFLNEGGKSLDSSSDSEQTNNEEPFNINYTVQIKKDQNKNIEYAVTEFEDGSLYEFSEDEFANIWYSEEDNEYYSNFVLKDDASILVVQVTKDENGNIQQATTKFDDDSIYEFSKDEYSYFIISNDDSYLVFYQRNTEEQTEQENISENKAEQEQLPVVYANSQFEKLQETTAQECFYALDNINNALQGADISDISVSSTFGNFLKGTSGIDKVKQEASIILERYKKLADSYKTGKNISVEMIEEFTQIRDDINTLYCKYIDELKDIFGNETIQTISPELFNFKGIEYLDVDSMLNNFILEYDLLNNKCTNLISEIGASFNLGAKAVTEAGIRSIEKGDKSDFLATALVVGVSHYASAYEKTNSMKAELEDLKNSLYHDVNNIQADEMRLGLIIKNLNDLFIPQANAFYIHSQNVMTDDLNEIIDAAYSTEELQKLRDERNELYKKATENKEKIVENSKELAETKASINECENNLNEYKNDWNIALRKRIFLNIWNLGIIAFIGMFLIPVFMGTDYKTLYSTLLNNFNYISLLYTPGYSFGKVVTFITGVVLLINRLIRNIKWHKEFGPIWNYYKQQRKILRLSEDYKIAIENCISQNIQVQKNINDKSNEISTEIRNTISANESIKSRIASLLPNLIKVLKVGKSILENKLENDLLKPSSFPEIQDISLSDEAQSQINYLTSMNNEAINIIVQGQNAVNKDLEARKIAITQNQESGISQEELQAQQQDLQERSQDAEVFNETTNKEISSIVIVSQIINSKIALNDKQKQGQLAKEKYDQAFQDLKNQFMEQLKGLDNQADVLNEALKKVHLAGSHDDLVQALSELTQGSGQEITKEDIEDMLAGKKTITI